MRTENTSRRMAFLGTTTTLSTLPLAVAAVLALLMLAGCSDQMTASASSASSSVSAPVSSSSLASAASESSSESGSNMSEQKQFGPLQSVEYSDSGNMLGNMYRIETDADEDGTLIVRESDSPQHDQRATIREFRAPANLLEQISDIADDAGMKGWGDLPMGEFFPLDASTPTITLVYENTDPTEYFPIRVSFNLYEELPESGVDSFNAVRDVLSDCLTEDNLIREYPEPDRN